MEKISITQLKKELSALHIDYASFCLIEKLSACKIEIIIQWASWLRDDIAEVAKHIESKYCVVAHRNNTYIITSK